MQILAFIGFVAVLMVTFYIAVILIESSPRVTRHSIDQALCATLFIGAMLAVILLEG